MKDESFTPFGMLPSLHERMRRLSKSRFRVSSTPIICIPTIGSPWNGMAVVVTICLISRRSVFWSTSKSPLSVSVFSRFSTVYILNTASWKKASFSCCAPVMPIRFTMFDSLPSKAELNVMPSFAFGSWLNITSMPSSFSYVARYCTDRYCRRLSFISFSRSAALSVAIPAYGCPITLLRSDVP